MGNDNPIEINCSSMKMMTTPTGFNEKGFH